ncbi:MAG: hypothetical protein IT305_26945 [Chloroflexi bacterium]|nr:hypothetical protein [Chloroflexota bacterium]
MLEVLRVLVIRAVFVVAILLAMSAAPRLPDWLQVVSPTSSTYAAPADATAQANKNDNDDDNNNGNKNKNDNGDNDNNSNDNDDNDNDGNDNEGSPPAPAPAAALPPAPVCTTPGQEMVFTSPDGRIAVRVFGTMNRAIQVRVQQPIDPATVPATPGTLADDLRFLLIFEDCGGNPISTLPAEVNLGIHYNDADVAGLNESNLTISHLNATANQWQPVAKQAGDPSSNYISATIQDGGYYTVYQK